MKLTSESQIFLGMLVTTAAVIGFAIWIFSRPTPAVSIPKETLIPAGAHTTGNKDASVYLVEFSDFQCPACRSFAPVVASLTKKYNDRLLFAYRHFPLPQHTFAVPAARAAEAAGRQGKFWEAVEILFANQDKFSDDFFSSQFIPLVAVDPSQYAKDLSSSDVTGAVRRDEEAARSLNLSSTPTFFLNGKQLPAPASAEEFIQTIEQALAKETQP